MLVVINQSEASRVCFDVDINDYIDEPRQYITDTSKIIAIKFRIKIKSFIILKNFPILPQDW